MWLPLLLLVGVVAIVASSTASARGHYGPPMVGPMPMLPPAPPAIPGPISVLGEFVRIGQVPPPPVILCAIAEAEARGREDIASDIVRVFVAPVVYQAELLARAQPTPFATQMLYAPGPMGTVQEIPIPSGPSTQLWPPEANYPGFDPRFGAMERARRGEVPARLQHARGSCAPARSPRDRGAPIEARSVEMPAAVPVAMPAAMPVTRDLRRASDDEIRAALNADPARFVRDVAAHAHDLLNDPNWSTHPATAHLANRPVSEAEVMSTVAMEAMAAAAREAVPRAVTPRPPSPPMVMPSPEPTAAAQPVGLPPEVVAQMQEASGLPQAADHTRAAAIGSPIAGVSDEAWRQFARRLEREALDYQSARHVGCYRQRRERLAELGVDPSRLLGSAESQRAALDADLADAYHHALQGGLLSEYLGRAIAIPGHDELCTITLSGMLGVIQCAGLDNAVGWLESQRDRKRFPHTTQAFLNTNGVF